MKSTKFLRGQVWHWIDPIYGEKSANNTVAIGETNQRYNRYVVIVDDSTRFDTLTDSILVAPCTSVGVRYPEDVVIPLTHVFCEDVSIVRPRSVMSVHPMYLDTYICTLPDETMDRISGQLIKLMAPKIWRHYKKEKESLVNVYGDLENPVEYMKAGDKNDSINDLINHVNDFIMKHLFYDESGQVTITELKNAYDIYCIKNSIKIEPDIIRFVDRFIKSEMVNMPGAQPNLYNLTDTVAFQGIAIDKSLKAINISISKKEKQTPIEEIKTSITTTAKQARLNDTEKIVYCMVYQYYKMNKCADEYGIQVSTAASRYSTWKKLIPDYVDKAIKFPADVNLLYKDDSIRNAISKMANGIIHDLHDWISYEDITSKIKGADYTAFWKQCNNSIYFSIFDYLGIQVIDTSHDNPDYRYSDRITDQQEALLYFLYVYLNDPIFDFNMHIDSKIRTRMHFQVYQALSLYNIDIGHMQKAVSQMMTCIRRRLFNKFRSTDVATWLIENISCSLDIDRRL